jgi:hypothetical protein
MGGKGARPRKILLIRIERSVKEPETCVSICSNYSQLRNIVRLPRNDTRIEAEVRKGLSELRSTVRCELGNASSQGIAMRTAPPALPEFLHRPHLPQ